MNALICFVSYTSISQIASDMFPSAKKAFIDTLFNAVSDKVIIRNLTLAVSLFSSSL